MSSRATCTLLGLCLLALGCPASESKATAEGAEPAEPAKAEGETGAQADPAAEPTTAIDPPNDPPAGTTGGADEPDTPNDPQTAEIAPVGVEACDAYIAAYTECVNTKAPEAEREAHLRTLGEQVHAWKQTKAGAPNADKALEIGCRGAQAAAAEASKDWGCEI